MTCGDYAIAHAGHIVAAVERKSLSDLVSSLASGRLRYQLGELAVLQRAAVVVEDRYRQIFALRRQRPSMVADGLAELQIRCPTVPIVFCDNRKLAEEWTYRYLAAAYTWAEQEPAIRDRIGVSDVPSAGPAEPPPSTPQLRAWAQARGLPVSDRGRIKRKIVQAWHDAHPADGP